MYKKICITNRHLVGGGFESFERCLERVLASGIDLLILREKELPEETYQALAGEVIRLCKAYDTECVLHTFRGAARALSHPHIHLSMTDFLSMSEQEKAGFEIIGVSTHSTEEAVQAEMLGASYVTASHIFPTECKAGLAPRGLDYLRRTAAAVSIPVYALGGIHPDNARLCIDAGAAGVCMMSEYMKGCV